MADKAKKAGTVAEQTLHEQIKEIRSHFIDQTVPIKDQIANPFLDEINFRKIVALFIQNIDHRLRAIEAKLDDMDGSYQHLKTEVDSIIESLNEIIRQMPNK